MVKSIKCPNCGAPYNPAKFECDNCGSFVFLTDENQFSVPQETIRKMEERINRLEADGNYNYPGTYVFGRLLGKGEIPFRLGYANYYISSFINIGGKLLLTGNALYFGAHSYKQKPIDLCIDLDDITSVTYDRNQLISDQISVYCGDKRHRFVVYGGREWVNMIQSTKNNPSVSKRLENKSSRILSTDYVQELTNLKKLLDAGVITEEEFTIKKRMILGF